MLVPIGEHCFVIFAESFRKNQDPKSLVRVESTKSQQASKLNRSMKWSEAAMQSLSCPEGMYFSPYICDPKNSDMGGRGVRGCGALELSRRTREFQDPVSVPPADYGLSTGVAGIEPSGLGQILEIGKPDHYLSLTSTNEATCVTRTV